MFALHPLHPRGYVWKDSPGTRCWSPGLHLAEWPCASPGEGHPEAGLVPEHKVTGRPRTGFSAPSSWCHLDLRVTCPWGPGGMWDPAGEGRRVILGKGDETSTGRSWKGQGPFRRLEWPVWHEAGPDGKSLEHPPMRSRVSCGGSPRRCGFDPGGGAV